MKFIVFIIGALACLFYTTLFLFIVSQNFVLNGRLDVSYDFEHESPFISLLKPRGRVDQSLHKDKEGDYYQTLLSDPVYFDVEFPRHFKTGTVQLTYKNPEQPLLELGLSRGENDQYFQLKPIENKLLDRLSDDPAWFTLSDGEWMLFQKKPRYRTIEDFIKSPPSDMKIATYNSDISFSYRIKNYIPMVNGLRVVKSLRGSHTMMTYVGLNRDLDITFNLQDMNRVINSDNLAFIVIRDNHELYKVTLPDDGIIDDSSSQSRPYDYRLHMKNPGEGVYRIKIITTDDVFIREIRSIEQDRLVFENFLYLGDNVGYLNDRYPERYEGTKIFTTTEKISAITSHKEAFQEISFGVDKIDINEKHLMFTGSYPLSERASYLQDVLIPKNDIKIIGKGLFVFSSDHFFDPFPLHITGDPNLPLDRYGVSYILARYSVPKQDGDWRVKDISFDFDSMRDADNAYRFVISFPYGRSEETKIDMSDIMITLKSDSLDIKDICIKGINRIKHFFKPV